MAFVAGSLCFGGFSSSCFLSSREPSTVARGLHYTSGNPAYDPFFDTLFHVQLKMGSAPQDEQEIRKQLARSIGADDKFDPGQLGLAVDEHAERLAKAGVGLMLTVDGVDAPEGTPSATLDTSGAPAGENDRKIIAAIDSAAQAEAKMIGDMRQMNVVSKRLREDAAALEPAIDTVFKKGGLLKRAEVKKNLKDAQAIIPLMMKRADEVESTAKEMLDDLVHVANTKDKVTPGGSEGTPKITLEEDNPSKPAPRKAPARASKPGATSHVSKPAATPANAAAAPPPPPPPAPAAPKDDFQP